MTKRKDRPAGKLKEESARYIPEGIDQPEKPMQTAKLFKNGRSQAVRLPKEFRFEGEEVYIRREGSSIVLSPKASPDDNPWKELFAAFDMFDPRFPIVRDQPPQQVRKSLDRAFPPSRRKSRST